MEEDLRLISYEAFGRGFIEAAVTEERLADAIAGVAGKTVKVGPVNAGPGGAAVAEAEGALGPIEVERVSDEDVLVFRARLPIDLKLTVRAAGSTHRFQGEVSIPLHVTVRAAEPLSLVIDVEEVERADVGVRLSAAGMASRLLQRLGAVDEEVKRRVVRIVNDRLQSEEAAALRRIDLHRLIDTGWRSVQGS